MCYLEYREYVCDNERLGGEPCGRIARRHYFTGDLCAAALLGAIVVEWGACYLPPFVNVITVHNGHGLTCLPHGGRIT